MNSERVIRQFKELKKISKVMRLAAEGWNEEWKILISTILSAQTKDETTIPVAESLFEKYGSVRKLSNAKLNDAMKTIRRANYYKTKARNVIACCKILDKRYAGKVPHDIDLLLGLPGVGRKTANVFLAEIGHKTIGVDTHVNYISNYLGWADSKNPEKVEISLKGLFPKRLWGDLNWVLVRFGKTHTSKKIKNEILDKVKNVR